MKFFHQFFVTHNSAGDPIVYVLTVLMKIVVIKETGNVFSYEAFNELNKKANNKKDLLNDVEFSWKNVIIINDPEKRKLIMNL